jgi:hypothetical protein
MTQPKRNDLRTFSLTPEVQTMLKNLSEARGMYESTIIETAIVDAYATLSKSIKKGREAT